MENRAFHSPIGLAHQAIRLWRAILFTLALCFPTVIGAQTPPASSGPTQDYAIEAMPLEQALMKLGTISRLDILYENGVVGGKQSSPVKGVFTPRQAMSALLQGTGLQFRFTSLNAVLVFPPARPPEPGRDAWVEAESVPRMVLDVLRVTATPMIGTPPHARFEPFGRSVQGEISQRLQNDSRTSGRPFQARLAVQLDRYGVIQTLHIARTTGDPEIDRCIQVVLVGARMPSPPPEGLPQPIWFDIAAR